MTEIQADYKDFLASIEDGKLINFSMQPNHDCVLYILHDDHEEGKEEETDQKFRSMLSQLFTHRSELVSDVVDKKRLSESREAIINLITWLEGRGFSLHIHGTSFFSNLRALLFRKTGL